MKRAEQAKKDCNNIIVLEGTPSIVTIYNQGVEAGVKWADAHPIISKKLLEGIIKGIESGEKITLSQYSNKPELSKVFDDGQISALTLLLEWLDYKQKGGKK